MEKFVFFTFAIVAVAAAINLLLQRHPIHSALSLIVVMGSLSVFYVLLYAEFIAMVQVIVYAGAIMVLFVFVIMLLNPKATEMVKRQNKFLIALVIPLALALLAQLAVVMQRASRAPKPAETVAGTTQAIGKLLFTDYLLPFEITSVLILIAILGAVVLAKKEL